MPAVDQGEEQEDAGQYVIWAPVHGEQDAILYSAVALHVEKLKFSKGCVYFPWRLQRHFFMLLKMVYLYFCMSHIVASEIFQLRNITMLSSVI